MPWWIIPISVLAGAGFLRLFMWWRERRAGPSEAAEELAKEHLEEATAKAEANGLAVRENASERLNEAVKEAEEKANENDDLASVLRARGAGRR